MHSSKAITPILAIIMLMVIVIGLAGGLYIWMTTTFQRTTNQTQQQLEQKIGQIQTTFHIEGVHGNEIYIRNDGSQSLDTTKLGVYVDGKRVSFTGAEVVRPGNIRTLLIRDMMLAKDKKMNIKVIGSFKSDEIIKNYVFYDTFEIVKNPPQNSFDLINGWSVDQSPHCGHCGCPCNDWCGDSGTINESDWESNLPNSQDDCSGKNTEGTAHLRGSSTLTSDPMNLSGISSATLTFFWRAYSCDGSEISTLEIYDGSGWVQLTCIGTNPSCHVDDDNTWHQENLDITSYLNSNFKIKFTGCPGSWDTLWVDEIKIS